MESETPMPNAKISELEDEKMIESIKLTESVDKMMGNIPEPEMQSNIKGPILSSFLCESESVCDRKDFDQSGKDVQEVPKTPSENGSNSSSCLAYGVRSLPKNETSLLRNQPIARKEAFVTIPNFMRETLSPEREFEKQELLKEESSIQSDSESSSSSHSLELISDLTIIRQEARRRNKIVAQKIGRKSAPIKDTNKSFSYCLTKIWSISTGNYSKETKGKARKVVSLLMRNNIGKSTHPKRVYELFEKLQFETRNDFELGELVLDFFREMGYVYYQSHD